jgi:hypothetical protein
MMLIMPIPDEDVDRLASGEAVHVKINGNRTIIAMDGEHLCYRDPDGTMNRCKILHSAKRMDGRGKPIVIYTCASHGMDDEPHCILEG